MDMITLAMAKAYTNSQRLASVEPSKVFTYDGGEDAEFLYVGSGSLRVATLSKDSFDLSGIKRIKCKFASTGQELEFVEGDYTLIDFGEFKALQVSLGNQTAPVVFSHPMGGLYGYAQEGFGYCSYVEFAETVHPIDPKYLPECIGAKTDIWDTEDVIQERDVDTAYDSAPGTHTCAVSYNFSEILARLKSAVEAGGTFMAAFPYGKLLPVCYSDTQICFAYCYDNVHIDIVCMDGVVKFHSYKATP